MTKPRLYGYLLAAADLNGHSKHGENKSKNRITTGLVSDGGSRLDTCTGGSGDKTRFLKGWSKGTAQPHISRVHLDCARINITILTSGLIV